MKKKPLRLVVIGTIAKNSDVDIDDNEDNVGGVFAYIISGKVRTNTKLILSQS